MTFLRAAEFADRELLRQLIADYLHEFDGRTEPYSYFDAYWEEPERLPFLIECDGDVAGFCLIRILNDCWHVAEFSILPAQRRAGIGRSTVNELAEKARAAGATELEAKVHPINRGALPFWLAAGFEIVSEPEPIVTRRKL
ncbi:MAG TPA: GNAT family N-acetyltransferase [Gaiellaceae bacterium]